MARAKSNTSSPRRAGRAAAYVTRFSVSLPPDVADSLDRLVAARNLPSRSHALAEMVRHYVLEDQTTVLGSTVAGTITIVYEDAGDSVRSRLTSIERTYDMEVMSSQHVFLEREHILEVLLVRGPSDVLNRLCDEIRACRGVLQARFTATAALVAPLPGKIRDHVRHRNTRRSS
jgi:CopG family nickel-responsive transcriptional regulator